jgi:hypothetical protein
MASSFKSPILQAIDQNGNPVPGAKLFVYQTGTTTPVIIYSDQSLTTPLPNPLIANARGYFANSLGVVGNIFWDGQPLRLLLTNADDSTIWQIDNYVSGPWASARGTAAAPAFTFTPDPNTGVFSRVADEINLAANGAEIQRNSSAGVDIRTGDLLRSGTKVVGARVINAALGNTANSGDANTDALITALKDIIIAHGLGAAS